MIKVVSKFRYLSLLLIFLFVISGCSPKSSDPGTNNNLSQNKTNINDTLDKDSTDNAKNNENNNKDTDSEKNNTMNKNDKEDEDNAADKKDINDENEINDDNVELIKVNALKGPTAMGMLGMMNVNDQLEELKKYDFEIVGTADEITTKLINGDIDIAAIPANLASILYNKTDGAIKVGAINTLGVLYILDTTDSIQTIEDLRGKTIYSVGKGTTPEFALNYVLKENDLLDDVTIEYKSEATELAGLFATGEAEIAMLPEPFVTTVLSQNEDIKIALNLTEEWNKVQEDFKLLTGTVVFSKKFVDENEELLEIFLDEYEASIDFINSNVEEGAKLVEKYGIVQNSAVAEQAIPRCNIVYIDADQMENDLQGYLNVLFEADPTSIGGKLPDENFYYKK